MTEELSTYQRLQNELSTIIDNAPKGTNCPRSPNWLSS